MAKTRRPKKHASTQPTQWERFAAISRAALPPDRSRAPGSKRKRAAAVSPQGATSLAQATSRALSLGHKQAEWVIAQRKEKLARRSKAVRAFSRSLAGRAAGSRGVLVAEGDSWFDYPFHDVLKELDDEFGWEIEQVAHKGDTVESMAYDGGQLDDFVRAIERVVRRGQSPHAILVSGGGNDVAGAWFGMLLNHRSSPVPGLNAKVVEGVLETRVRVAYTTILSAVTSTCEQLLGRPVPILLHGYDYPVPDGRGVLGGWGWLPGPWLEPGFREKGFDDLGERVGIARDLIERFYAMLGKVVATSAFSHVTVVDLRGSLSSTLQDDLYKDSWGNELHPTREGFVKVAGLFNEKL
jgi:lysophospholipase L1-like esterase